MPRLKLQEIELQCGIDVTVDWNSKTKCEKCGAEIWWAVTENEKFMPIVLVGNAEWDTHFADCPSAKEFKKKGKNNGKN